MQNVFPARPFWLPFIVPIIVATVFAEHSITFDAPIVENASYALAQELDSRIFAAQSE
jgi:hypothetical protein